MSVSLFYGYRLRSEIPFAGLPPLPSGVDADIELTVGTFPHSFIAPAWETPFVAAYPDMSILFRGSERVRFLIQAGRSIIVERTAQATDREVETFLVGMVAGILLHQRGDLPLHASCVQVAGKAIVFVGPSGSGKSTFAAVLARRGHRLLSDDVCRVDFSGGSAAITQGSSGLRLWSDSMLAVGQDPDSLPAGSPNPAKRTLIRFHEDIAPAPLAGVIRCGIDRRVTVPSIERLRGPSSITPVEDLVYRARLGRQLGRREELFRNLTRLGSAVPIFRLKSPPNLSDLEQTVDLAIATVRSTL